MTGTGPAAASRQAASGARGRGLTRLLLLALFLGAAAVVATMCLTLLQARRDMLDAASMLDATAGLASPSLLHQSGERRHVHASLVTAEAELRAAQGRIEPWASLLSRLGWVPMVGHELDAAPAVSAASLDSVQATLDLLDGLQPIFAEVDRTRSGSPPPRALGAALVRGEGRFRLAQEDAERAQAEVSRVSRTGTPALDTAVQRLRTAIPLLAATTRWLVASPALLGVGRTSRDLVLIQDPRELRATGGFIGASGMVALRDGVLSWRFGSSVLPHELQSVPPPAPEMLYTPESSWLFRDSNWSPDFPLSARIARWFYARDTGEWADGVIAVQTSLAPSLLAITGPVYLPAYGKWVGARTVAAIANRYINGAYHGPSTEGRGDTVRKQFVGDVFAAVLGRLVTLPAARWPDLAALVTRATTQRTILLYDRRPAVEAAIQAVHAGGSFRPGRGDMLAIVDDNRSYNKIGPYVQEHARYTVRIQPDLSTNATLSIRYHVLPSPADLEGCGLCSLTGTSHDYQDFLRVFVPNGAAIGRVSGLNLWKPRPAYGMMQAAGRLVVREGQMHVVTIRYRMPANLLQDTGFTHYRLTIWHQPGTVGQVTMRVEGAGGVQVDGRSVVRANLRVTRDQRIVLHVTGAGMPRTVVLPRRVWKDPYIPPGVLTASHRPL